MGFKLSGCLVKEIVIKPMLASLKTVHKSKDCSEVASELSFLLSFAVISKFSPVYMS
jgi:hypothetical protein